MTGPGEDSQKHKADDAAKYLAESFFGLNMNPAEVGGEVLFDEYDDVSASSKSIGSKPNDADDLDTAVLVSGASGGSRSVTSSPPNRFEENLDDLIVFSEDDDDDVIDDDEEEDEDEDDENFDFGDDEEEEDDEEDDDDDFEDDDDEEDDDEDVVEDEDLDFGSDVIDPAPKKAAPVARDSRSEREQRGSDSRSTPARPARAGEGDQQRTSAGQREQRPAPRDSRSQGSAGPRAEASSDRPHAAKSADAGRKSGTGDDDYWKELDGWVWDEETTKKPAAVRAPLAVDPDEDDDDDDDDDEDVQVAAPEAASDKDDDEAPARRRGRRRGGRGRGRGRGRRDEKDASEPVGKSSESSARGQDFDDDFSEIMFEEDQEDFVSVSAGSVKAQRRIIEEPPSPAARVAPDELEQDDDADEEDGERSEEGEGPTGSPRRGRRGRRGRGRGRGPGAEETREPARKDVRPAASARRPVRDEDDMDDDDDDQVEDDTELAGFGDLEDDDAPPRRREGAARPQRAPESDRGRNQGDRPPRESGTADRSDRRPVRERQPVAAGGDRDERRGPRPGHVAPEFQGIPTWEEAIGSLEIRTPTEEHARRAESRGRRDGGRPPRRRN